MIRVYCQPDGVVVCAAGALHAPDPSWIVLELPELPRGVPLERLRWDGRDGLRPATDVERAARETVTREAAARQALAATRVADAVVEVLAKRLGVDPTVLREEVVTELTKTPTARVTVAPVAGRAGG